MSSLQRRVIVGGFIWAVLTTVIGAFAIISIFNQLVERRFNDALVEQHLQLVVALTNANSPEDIEGFLATPSYRRAYSGRYWQAEDNAGNMFTSPSLFDSALHTTGTGFAETKGPLGTIRSYSEIIVTEDGTEWLATVASSLSQLLAEQSRMRRSVTLAFGLVGLLGVAGAGLLTAMLLRPLRQLRHDVSRRWDTDTQLRPEDYPLEVAPLVSDINELIERNRNIHKKGRRQAADLAHALKTPLAGLRNELSRMSDETDETEALFDALDRIDVQITRSLARMRAASAVDAIVQNKTSVPESVTRLERVFTVIAQEKAAKLDVDVGGGYVAVDQQDFEEMLGNLLDNAVKWAKQTVRVSTRAVDDIMEVRIEDDGPGVDANLRSRILEEGARLDTAVPGTGLGLSIVNDLSQAYGGELSLGKSQLGGLLCALRLPTTVGMKRVTSTVVP
ncbi:MAG: HAMP domain-containing sensor histidine kinase [Pseudomonadota bacterium]